MQTEYEFVLPRGYVDDAGAVHKRGTMRLATARDELEPLRDPFVTGADDPMLTIVVLSRVVTKLGTLPLVTRSEIEGLFAADLAYLQDFYGVINFGTDDDIAAMLAAQRDAEAAEGPAASGPRAEPAAGADVAATASGGGSDPAAASPPGGRRSAIEELPSRNR